MPTMTGIPIPPGPSPAIRGPAYSCDIKPLMVPAYARKNLEIDGISRPVATTGAGATRANSVHNGCLSVADRATERFKAVCRGEKPDYVPPFGFSRRPGMSQGL